MPNKWRIQHKLSSSNRSNLLMLLLVASRLLIFFFAALNIKSTIWRSIAFSSVICLALADVASTRTDNANVAIVSGIILGINVFEAMRYLLLTRPLEEFRHEADKVPAYRLSFVGRFFWLTSILHRGIGWSFLASTGCTASSIC